MHRATRALLCCTQQPNLGANLRLTTAAYTDKLRNDPSKVREVAEKAELFLERIQPRLESSASRGNSAWRFAYEEDFPIQNSTGCIELEDELGFQWAHLIQHRQLYVDWFAQRGLKLNVYGHRSENRDHGTCVYLRRIVVEWD
eukprot:TRINITY_DN10369_c0_g1_i1.p1 TRINITY_DN10369_c0_g1~~TRINITY_DN10369_c0_g1_i1.p1  ORF type:complete len:143 (-),score=33.26 TRINITY_DN10369_c0_g1_i1:15-443(-)